MGQNGAKLKSVAATGGRLSPSVARSLDAHDAASLASVAQGLPPGWVVTVTPPHGQLAILPREYVHVCHRTWIADREVATVYRMNSGHSLRVPPAPLC
jgi:hypothetical protein